MPCWPTGVYEGPPSLWTHLVVVSELPVVRSTLLLRLLGAGQTQEHAITEIKALPADAPERLLALPILTRLRLDILEDEAQQTADEKEFLKMTQNIVDAWRQEAVQEGFERGAETGSADALVDLYEIGRAHV